MQLGAGSYEFTFRTQLQTMSRSKRPNTSKALVGGRSFASLKTTDKTVLKHLEKLARAGDENTCTVSIPKLASACGISQRQVQISANRLIEGGLLRREGYDFSNPDRTKRGTVYKLLSPESNDNQEVSQVDKKRAIKFLLFWSED